MRFENRVERLFKGRLPNDGEDDQANSLEIWEAPNQSEPRRVALWHPGKDSELISLS